MEQLTNKFGAIIPKKITKSFENFISEIQHSEFLLLMFFVGGELIEKNLDDAREMLATIFEDPQNEVSKYTVKAIKSKDNDQIFRMGTYEQFYGQMCYARTIDNILTYFKEVLAEVILNSPNILKSKETERLDFILKFENIADLRIALSEKKIDKLFYSGIDDIELFFKDRLGIKLFEDEDYKIEFNQAVKSRNLIVHNRGNINNQFIKEFPELEIEENSSFVFSYKEISELNISLSNFLCGLDAKIALKFNLNLIDNLTMQI